MSPALARRIGCALLERIGVGSVTVVQDGAQRTFGSGAPTAKLLVHDQRTWPMLLRGSRGLAESYSDGLWDSPDLVALIRLAARNVAGLDRLRVRLAPVRGPLAASARGGHEQHAAAQPPGRSLPTTTSVTSSSRGCSIRR